LIFEKLVDIWFTQKLKFSHERIVLLGRLSGNKQTINQNGRTLFEGLS